MAEERKDPNLPKPPPPLPPLPPVGGPGGTRPPLPALPPLPPLGGRPPGPAPHIGPGPAGDMERKLAEMERRLQEEREKVLLANLRSSEEQVTAAKVESSIKEIQDKLRRDRRDADMEQTRLKLEARITELEQKLVSERETWVTTLKGQVRTREVQDREIESHFATRMQEMERRWLEEKAHWQKVMLSKDEEIRQLRALAEKLKGVELEFQKVSQERKFLDERASDLAREVASTQAQLKAAAEHEKDFYAVKADMTVAKEQAKMLQDKLEREVSLVRSSAKEREERLMADNERLQRDVQTIYDRARAEGEVEIKKHKAQAELAGAALQRMRAVGSALERQIASLRVQADEALKAKKDLDTMNDRYKAEFMVLQRRWQEREKEVRKEAEAAMQQVLETEKTKIKLRAQEEVQNRVGRVQEQMHKDAEASLAEKERGMRSEVEAEVMTRGQRLEAKLKDEIGALRKEILDRESHEKERLLAKESELASARSMIDELRGHLAKEEQWRKTLVAEKEDVERARSAYQAEAKRAHELTEEAKGRLAKEEEWKRVLLQEKAALERTLHALQDQLARGGRPPSAPNP